ncbi:MAG: biotin-dependent carboxyltransferase family protein [Agriterribacter sp.]
MSLKIIKPGIYDTVQDLGRHGFQQLGINPGGAMDAFMLQAANLLAGNTPGEAVLEMSFPAPVILFEKPAIIVLSGADFCATVNGEIVPLLQPIAVSKNSELQFQQRRTGRWCYLAVQGGIQADQWLKSFSTHVKVGSGGYKGRLLQKNDLLSYPTTQRIMNDSAEKAAKTLNWKSIPCGDDFYPDEIAILPGNEWKHLNNESKQVLEKESFVLTPSSDRMGYTFRGPSLSTETPFELVSSGVQFGTVQLLPNGQLIALMADHQTTGGYPRIAHVIKAHRGKLAQMKEAAPVKFRMVDTANAERLLLQQEQHLVELNNACTFKWEQSPTISF